MPIPSMDRLNKGVVFVGLTVSEALLNVTGPVNMLVPVNVLLPLVVTLPVPPPAPIVPNEPCPLPNCPNAVKATQRHKAVRKVFIVLVSDKDVDFARCRCNRLRCL